MATKIFADSITTEEDKKAVLRKADPFELIRAYAIASKQFDPLADIDDSVIIERELMRRLILLKEITERLTK